MNNYLKFYLYNNKKDLIKLIIVFFYLILSTFILSHLKITNTMMLFNPNQLLIQIIDGTGQELFNLLFSSILGLFILITWAFSPLLIIFSMKIKNELIKYIFITTGIIILLLHICNIIHINTMTVNVILAISTIIIILKSKLNANKGLIIVFFSILTNIIYQVNLLSLVNSMHNSLLDINRYTINIGEEYKVMSLNKYEKRNATINYITNDYKDFIAIHNFITRKELENEKIIQIMDNFYKNDYSEDRFFDKYLPSTLSRYYLTKEIHKKYKETDTKIIAIYKKHGLKEMLKYINENKPNSLLANLISKN